MVNWIIDVDLPIGYSFPLEREPCKYERCFARLDHAFVHQVPMRGARKRHKAGALHRFIRQSKRFIASTHGKPVESMEWPHYTSYPERKVYCRRR